MALIRWSKSLKAVGFIKIILFLLRRVQNKCEYQWNIEKTALKFWVLSIGKSRLKFWNTDFAFFLVKNEKQKRISTLKSLSSRWITIKKSKAIFFSFYSQRLTVIETPSRRDPFWISRKNAKHINPWDLELNFLFEIHFEDGFLSVESCFWISCFTAKSEFPISKSKSRFVEVKHSDFFEHGVFFLIGLD